MTTHAMSPHHKASLPDAPFRTFRDSNAVYTGSEVIVTSNESARPPAALPTHASVMEALHGESIWSRSQELHSFLQLAGIRGQRAWSPSPSPAFIDAIIQRLRPQFVIEIGTFLGATSIMLAQALDALHGADDRRSLVLSIDTWLGDAYMWSSKSERYKSLLKVQLGKPLLYYQFLSNVRWANVTHRIVPLPLSTNEAARVLDFCRWRPDLVYIDASHDAIDVLTDLEHYYYLLQCNGTLFGDDFHWPGVRSAVTHFAQRRQLDLQVFEIHRAHPAGVRVPPTKARGNTKWVLQPKTCRVL